MKVVVIYCKLCTVYHSRSHWHCRWSTTTLFQSSKRAICDHHMVNNKRLRRQNHPGCPHHPKLWETDRNTNRRAERMEVEIWEWDERVEWWIFQLLSSWYNSDRRGGHHTKVGILLKEEGIRDKLFCFTRFANNLFQKSSIYSSYYSSLLFTPENGKLTKSPWAYFHPQIPFYQD